MVRCTGSAAFVSVWRQTQGIGGKKEKKKGHWDKINPLKASDPQVIHFFQPSTFNMNSSVDERWRC